MIAQRNARLNPGWDPAFAQRHPALRELATPVRAPAWPAWPDVNQLGRWFATHPAIYNVRGRQLRLISDPRGGARDYEQRIHDAGELPVHCPGWHDIFNVLVWMRFPRAKAALNARHVAAYAKAYGARDAHGDALTGFDESGLLVLSTQPRLLNLIRAFRWHELFWQHRAAVTANCRFALFGHGLCEQLLRPYLGLTAKAVLIQVTDLDADLDAILAPIIATTDNFTSPRYLQPVPILGIPGWWAANETESFYHNRRYFRPGRQARS